MKPSLFLLAALAGCAGDDIVPERDPYIPQEPATGVIQALSHDCRISGIPAIDAYQSNAGGLHIVGIGEARGSVSPFDDPDCRACLDNPECTDFEIACAPKAYPASVVAGQGVKTLVLASLSPVNWTVTTGEASTLERVYVTGYYNDIATVDAPAGVVVHEVEIGAEYQWYDDQDLSLTCEDELPAQFCEGEFGVHWQEQRDAAIEAAQKFIADAERLAGDKLGSFHGCYSMSKIELGRGPDCLDPVE